MEFLLTELPTDKAPCRKLFRERRRSLSQEIRAEKSRLLCQAVLSLPAWQNSATVLLYCPVGEEPDLLPLARSACALGKQIAFPRCEDESGQMRFRLVPSPDALTKGKYGIPEPAGIMPEVSDFSACLCIVPALAFDTDGFRLGYGGGYYDRFLSAHREVTSLGAVFSDCLSGSPLPREAHDRPVDLLITEERRILPK